MIKITHPHAHLGKAWTCSGCECLVVDASVCATCYAALCPVCAAAAAHVVPAGDRAGRQCVLVAVHVSVSQAA